jgi:hypothetical protein
VPPDPARRTRHRTRHAARVAALVLAGLAALAAGPAAADRVMLGRLEMIEVVPGGRVLKARIDTGAGLTSVDARKLRITPAASGQPERASFRLRGQPRDTADVTAAVLEWVEIKGKGTKRTIRRPVVAMQLCIGERWVDARVNLADRSGFLYPLLIGRNTLIAGGFVVDPGALYLEPPRCPAPAPGAR